MSSWEEYINKKKKKKQSDTTSVVRQNNQSSNTSSSSWSNYLETRNSQKSNVNTDIAPINNNKRTWFSSGAFSDGYQIGDITKTLLGTNVDFQQDIAKGAANIFEGAIDTGAYLLGGGAKLIGQDKFAGKMQNFIERDLVEESKVANKMANNSKIGMLNNLINKNYDALNPFDYKAQKDGKHIEGNSVLGDKSDSLVQSGGQLAGTIGLQAVGVPWWVTSGVTSFGGQTEEAFNNDATYKEAGISGLVSAGAEILTEKLFGGISFGGKTLDAGLKSSLTKSISNRTVKTLAKYGFDIAGEGTEEVLSEVMSSVGKKLTYEDEKTWQEILASPEAMDSYLESFIGGAVLGGGANSIGVIDAFKTGRDYDTGLSANEESVVKAEVEARVDEQQKNGKTLTEKEIAKIEEEVVEDIKKGYISTDVIENTIGKKLTAEQEADIETQLNTLLEQSKKTTDQTAQQQITEQMNELESQLNTSKNLDISKDNYLLKSYQEKELRKQSYTYEKTNNAIEDGLRESASKVMNNTARTHEFVDTVVKIAKDTNTRYEFTNTEELKKAGYNVEGKTINGLVSKDGKVLINIDTNRALNTIIGHETTHLLEGTQEYEALQYFTREYAKSKGIYEETVRKLNNLYKDTNADVNAELTADLVGDLLFTDQSYIDNLSAKQPNVFQRIYDYIKHIYKKATAGSKEARQLEELKYRFDQAYKKAGKQTSTDTKYSFLGVEMLKDNKEAMEMLEEVKKLKDNGVNTEYLRQNSGWMVGDDGHWKVEVDDSKSRLVKKLEKNKTYDLGDIFKHDKLYDLQPKYKNIKVNTRDINSNGKYSRNTGEITLSNKIINDPEQVRSTLLHEIQHATQHAENWQGGTNVRAAGSWEAYLNNHGEKEAQEVQARRNMSFEERSRIAPSNQTKIQYSLTDNQGRTLSKEQQEYFKDSKVRDETGNLLEVYHGTPDGGFNTFDLDKFGQTDEGYLGEGFYFTNSESAARDYSMIDQWDEGDSNTPEIKKVYLNIKNPFVFSYKDAEYDHGMLQNIVKSEDGRTTPDLIEQGYDGIIYEFEGGEKEIVAFYPEQIKNVDNTNPTTDPDIRYSLSEDNKGNTLSKEQQERYKYSKIRDENGSLKVMYHGTQRADRVGTLFDPNKATSGPMAFFTDNQDIAKNYSENKADTSLSREYDTEYDLFKVDGKDLDTYWNSLSKAEQQKINKEGNNVGFDDDWENVVYGENASENSFSDMYKWYLNNQEKGNGIKALYDVWVQDGNIMGDDLYKFQEVLEKAGIKNVEFLDPYKVDSKVYEVYLNITNPFDTSNMSEDIINQFKEASKTATIGEQYSADAWDKSNIAPEDWISKLESDIAEGTTHAWTVIPDWVTNVLKANGYDGIVDTGGKNGGETHQVVIPFYSEQIKDITNINPTDNPNIDMSLSNPNEDIAPTGNWNVYGKDVRLQVEEAIAPLKEAIANLTEQVKDQVSNVENIDLAPAGKDIAEQQNKEAFNNITDKDAPSFEDLVDEAMWSEDYESTSTEHIPSPLDSRDIDEVGDRKVKAYQYENPEVKPYFQAEAQNMLYDLDNTIKGERIATQDEEGYITGWAGITRQTTEAIAYLKDNYGYSYDQIRKGLNAIIEDDGKENNAVSKRIEFMLDERLREGYTTSDGYPIPPNEEYINFLNEKQITEYNKEAFNAITDDNVPPEQTTMTVEPKINPSEQVIPIAEKTAQNGNTDVVEGKQRKWIKTSTESEVVNREILPDDLNQTKIFYQPITNKATLGTANAKLDTLGYEKAVEYFNNQVLNKTVKLEDIVLGERLIQEAIKNKDTKTAGELIQNVAILGTELGQKVQALSIIQRMTPEGQLKMLEKTINRGKTKGDKAFTDINLTDDMKKKILDTYNEDGSYDQDKLNEAVNEVKQQIADQMPSTTMDKINEWRYFSMLGNPKTHIRNLVSNVAMKGTMAVKNALARTIEEIAPIKNRTRTWKPASQEIKNYAEKTALEMKDVISGDSKYSETADIKAKRKTYKSALLNWLTGTNSNILEVEDWLFSKSAFKNSFSEFLTVNGINTEQDIQNNPELIAKGKQYAVEQAQIATFRQYSWLSNKMNDIERKNTATQIAMGAVLPFKKTPINIAKTGLSYSPLGFIKSLTYDVVQVKKGNMEASTLIDHIAQNTTGTALTLVGYMLAQAGFLNGAGDDDKEGKYDYQLGKQAYSINIGDNTYSLSWLSPVAMPLFVGANAYEQLVEGEEWNADLVLETLGQTLDPLSEMSFLSSLDSVLSSYDSGVQRFFGIGEAMAQNYVTQFVPTVSSQVAATLDDTKRSTKVAGDSTMKVFEETYNKLIYKIPGLRETLEPSTDIWGNEIKQSENLFARAFENFIAPYARKESIATEIDEELKDLYAQTGDNGIIPSIPYNYVNYDGEKYKMSAEEYTDYKKMYGQTANDLLEDLFRTKAYKNATSEERVDMVNDVYEYARDEAKLDYLAKEGVDYTNATEDKVEVYRENLIKGAIENNMTTKEYGLYLEDPEEYKFIMDKDYKYRQKYFDTYDSLKELDKSFEEQKEGINDDDELDALYSEKKAGIVDKIINSGLDDNEKASLYKKYYNSDTVDTIIKSAINIDDYLVYETKEFKADKNAKGNSIPGSRKDKIIDYVNTLDLDIPQKAILIKSTNTFKFNDYNSQIVDYVSSLDIDYEDMVSILEDLDMTVKDDMVYWD